MLKTYEQYLSEINDTNISYNEGYIDNETREFWGNVAGGVLPICLKTKRILLSFRSKFVYDGRTWGTWGGKIDEEDGEVQSDIKDVVRREFREETGFDCDCFELVPAYIFETPNGSFKYYNFIGLFEEEFKPVLDWETEKFKWVTIDELKKIQPKHFGLKALLDHDLNKIENYCR